MTHDIGKDLEALRPLPARLAELTSDLRKLATCGQPTCLERRALSMLEELGLELAQPGANVVEFDKYQPSAGEVLKNIRAWALSETSQRYFQNLSSNPDGAGERFLAEHPTFAHWATSRMVCALLGDLHGPEGYALARPQLCATCQPNPETGDTSPKRVASGDTSQPSPSAGEVLRQVADFVEAARAWSNEKRKANPDTEIQQEYWRQHHKLQFGFGPEALRALAIPDNAVPGMAGIPDKPVIPVKPEREMLAGLASSMAADIAYFELQAERRLAEGEAETAARYQARLRILRPYLARIEGLMEFARLIATAPAEVAQ